MAVDLGLTDVLQKLRTLPFRSSPTSRHTLLFSQSSRSIPKPPILTPAESSEDDETPPSHSFSLSSRHKSSSQTNSFMHVDTDGDSDFDMADSQPSTSPAWTSPMTSPCSTTTGPQPRAPFHVSQNSINGTRIPTPIYSHFNAMDASMNMMRVPDLGRVKSLQSQQDVDYDLFIRRRRLPSPISEDEAMDSPTAMTGGMLGRLDMDSEQSHTLATVAAGISETKPQFARRGAVAGLGSKLTFSMGYRADCEKCRTRVPGHYSHVTKL